MNVKVCNMRSNDLEKDLIESIVNTGFVVLTHHGISYELIKDVQSSWREFFLSSTAEKNLFSNKEDGNLGWKGMKTEKAVGAKVADIKEFFHWKPGQVMPPTVYDNTARLFHQLEDVAGVILKIIDRENARRGERTTYSDDCYQSDNTLFRTLYYPALSKEYNDDLQDGAVRAAAHEDINHITLLVAASAPGLQVKDAQGNWHDVPHEENSIVVNIGDMMQLASNGLYKSTTHRVINPDNSNTDRISMPLFVHPHSNTLLAPGITAKQFLDQRLAEIYGIKK